MLFSGCIERDIEMIDDSRFKHIYYNECCIIVDKETRVMYLLITVGASVGAGLTVMLNPDGTPMIWEGELEGETNESVCRF